ncbi:MAG: GNAT family N-acetyltransferase [Alphaproteobacteria bacterium]|nr:GNAT family N-acetyltransferase [Alphaproteobacteria bacterium]
MATIRSATPEDVPRLALLNSQIQNWHVRIYPKYFNAVTDPAAFEPFWADMVTSSNHVVLLADTDDEIVGYALVERQSREQNTFMRPANRIYLHHIHVGQQMRRSGIGRALMVEIEKLAGAETEIALDTWQLNTAAHEFFQAHGFEVQRLLLNKQLT